MIRFSVFNLASLYLCACSTAPKVDATFNQLYCDRYLMYPMCTMDATGNGRADFVYFEDSSEIFLYNNKFAELAPDYLTMHQCAQSMDKSLIDATSLLLTVNEDTGFFRRNEIKNGIFFHYMRYLPRVSRCKKEDPSGNEETVDDFGIAENAEF